jgi:hypothetical protein
MTRRKAIVIFGAALAVMRVVTGPSAAAAETFQTFVCADGAQFVAAFYPSDPKRAHLQVDGKAVALARRLLSGTRYSGGGVTLAISKAGTTLKLGKRPVTACSKQ